MKAVLLKVTFLFGLILGMGLHPLALRAQDLNLDQAKAGTDKGDPNAEFCLGRFYANGQGVPRDYAKAAEFYLKAAGQGFGKAQNNLGILYLQGRGVNKDQAEASKWLQKAASQGLPKSQTTLASILVKQDGASSEGIELFRKAAGQGSVDAQVRLAEVYYFGTRDIKRDYPEAAKWYLLAANQGNPNAENALGVINENGFGMQVNEKVAVDWYRKAADQGDAKGQSNYGRVNADGVGGLEVSPSKAYLWLSLSAQQGEVTAQNFLAEYVAAMKPDQLAEGKRLLQEYNARHSSQSAPGIGH